MKRKVMALLLAATMVIGLAACGDDKTDTQKDGQGSVNQESSSQKEDTDTAEEFDPMAAYEDTVTITAGIDMRPDPVFAEGDDETNNPWIRSYLERFNIDLEATFVVDVSEYNTKVNLAIAEANLPDVFYVSRAQLMELVEADLLYDMTDVFETYASDTIKGYMEADPTDFESGMIDGKLYGIAKLHTGELPQPNYIWIRKDWKEALKLEDPKSMDDVVDMAKAFMEEYDSEGIGVTMSLKELKLIAPAWGAYPELWVRDESGKVVYGNVQPEMKNALAAWAEWYKEGIIGHDFITTDTAKLNEDAVTGKLGIYPYYQWWGYAPGPDVVANLGPEAVFEPYEIPSAINETVLNPLTCGNQGFVVVSKACKNPEAIMKMLNFTAYMSTTEAVANEEPEVLAGHLENGMIHANFLFRISNPNAELEAYQAVRTALDTGDTSVLDTAGKNIIYNESVAFMENGDGAGVGNYLQQGADRSVYSIAEKILEEERIIRNVEWGNRAPTMMQTGSTLGDILVEGFTKIIVGEESIDYFDELVEKWMEAGGEQATIEMNEIYGN